MCFFCLAAVQSVCMCYMILYSPRLLSAVFPCFPAFAITPIGYTYFSFAHVLKHCISFPSLPDYLCCCLYKPSQVFACCLCNWCLLDSDSAWSLPVCSPAFWQPPVTNRFVQRFWFCLLSLLPLPDYCMTIACFSGLKYLFYWLLIPPPYFPCTWVWTPTLSCWWISSRKQVIAALSMSSSPPARLSSTLLEFQVEAVVSSRTV